MFEQIFDSVRKASESSVQLQQEMLKQLSQQFSAMPAQGTAGMPEWGRGLQRRWAELVLDILRKQRESMDAAYASGIQIIEQTFRVSEAKSADDYRKTVEDLWRKLFDSFKDRSETQMRDFQKWSEKSAEIVQMLGLSPRAWEHLQTLYQLGDPRQVQRRWLADLRMLMADYARSPAFLALMRWNLNAMTGPTPLSTQFFAPHDPR